MATARAYFGMTESCFRIRFAAAVVGLVAWLPAAGCAGPNRAVVVDRGSRDARASLVREYYEQVVGAGDLAAVPRYISPDYVYVHDGQRHRLGVDGEREHIEGVRRTYPDLKLSVERQIVEGEWVASLITARGTHLGEWLNMRPTGKRVTFTGVNIDRVVNGQIVEHTGAANLLGPLMDIGAVCPADPMDADSNRRGAGHSKRPVGTSEQ